jgi:hypothetical protein
MIDVLAIVGSDQWPDGAEARVKALLRDYLAERPPDLLITSGVADVDSWAVEVARELGIPYDDLNYLPAYGHAGSRRGSRRATSRWLRPARACSRWAARTRSGTRRAGWLIMPPAWRNRSNYASCRQPPYDVVNPVTRCHDVSQTQS